MTQPTRLERKVRRLFRAEQRTPWELNEARFIMLVSKLLLAEHRAIRRMVRQMKQQHCLKTTAEFPTTQAYRMACDDILRRLTAMGQ